MEENEKVSKEIKLAKIAYSELENLKKDDIHKIKELHDEEIKKIKNSIKKEKEETQENNDRINKQIQSLKEMLRESESDRTELVTALENSNKKIEALDESAAGHDAAVLNIRKELEDDIISSKDAVKNAEIAVEEQKALLTEAQATAVEERLSLKAEIETLQIHLATEKKEKIETVSKCKEKILALKDFYSNKMSKMTEESKCKMDIAVEQERSKQETVIQKMTLDSKICNEKFEKTIMKLESEIEELQKINKETLVSTEVKLQSIMNTEKQLDTVINKKQSEVDLHAKLRQQAKKETLALNAKLEDRSAALDLFNRSLQDIVVPRIIQMLGSIQQVEFNLDATLSAWSAQNEQTNKSFMSIFNSNSRTNSPNNDDINSNASVHSAESSILNYSSDNESLCELDEVDRLSNEKPIRRRSSMVEFASIRVDSIQKKVAISLDSLNRILEKVKRVCSLALEEKSAWNTVSGSLKRSIEDCILRVPSSNNSNAQTANRHVQLTQIDEQN